MAARRGSPLIIGVGKDEYIVASDAAAIVEHTRQVIYLDDGEMAVLSPAGFHTATIALERVERIKGRHPAPDERRLHDNQFDLVGVFKRPLRRLSAARSSGVE